MTSYAKARISNPAHYFETPVRVLSDDKLSRDDKVKVLRSMVLDAEQRVEATSEGMAGANPPFNTKELQSALIQLGKTKEPETDDSLSLQPCAQQWLPPSN